MEYERGILIREAIVSDSFPRLSNLVKTSTRGVDFQSKIGGDTPMLLCLKLKRDYNFIGCLIKAGASLARSNKYGISAISFAAAYCHGLVGRMLEESRHAQALLEAPYSEEMRHAFSEFRYKFVVYVTNEHRIDQKVLLCIKTSFSMFHSNVAFRELKVFLDDLTQWGCMQFNAASKILLDKACRSTNPVTFNILWPRLDKKYIFYVHRNFLRDYITQCKFSNCDFRKCLNLILTSEYAGKLKKCPVPYASYKYLYSTVFRKLRRENKFERLETLSLLLNIYPPTMDNVIEAYILYGFEEEELLFVRTLKSKVLTTKDYESLLAFLRLLQKNEKLRSNNLHKLPMSHRLCYHKLLFLLPKLYLKYDAGIEAKRQLLDEIRLSNDTCEYVIQKWFQKQNFMKCVIL